MFEGLKKKFSNFINSVSKKEGEKAAVEEDRAEAQKQEAQQKQEAEPKMEEIKHHQAQHEEIKHEEVKPQSVHHVEEKIEEAERPSAQHIEMKQSPTQGTEISRGVQRERAEAAKKEKIDVTAVTKLKGIIFREVKVSENDIEPFLEDLKISLIKSDVNYDAAERILDSIRRNLVGKALSAKDIEGGITQIIRQSVFDTLNKGSSIDIISRVKDSKAKGELPFKILFTGPNGAGKTTTMAKVAHMITKNGFTCVLSASDTFRAAAIEQTVFHAGKLGVSVIKGRYGDDPASIAFDAIAHAKAHSIDVVLIDSAGRQETNRSLMEEMKKMVRVTKPNLKIFVGESVAGNALLDQVREFNEAVSLDGIILTKLDCDAKGGNTLTILSEVGVPILYFGIGEGYDALMPYSSSFIIDSMLPNN